MWLCLNRSFISVVADRNDPGRLLVRARVAGHIEALFPNAAVFKDHRADYSYRAFIDREQVAQQIGLEMLGIEYDNFKSSVADQALHDAYLGFWRIMHKLQDSYRKRI